MINKVEKPEEKKVSADVTAKSVLEKYITAVGGQKAVADVKSLFLTGTTNVPGAPAPLTYINKTDASGKLLVELTMSGMSMMKQVVNGNTGFMAQQGQKMNLEGEMLEDMKGIAHPFPEVNLLKKEGITLKGIESQDGKECYAVVNGKTTSYYEVATGLKVADVTATPQGSTAITYKDYRDVKGVKIPYNYVMNVGFDLDIKISDIKVNEGVSEADFQ